jgi:hypothetical protein
VTIRGTHLAGATKVTVGPLVARVIGRPTARRIRILTPAAWPDRMHVRVRTAGGTSAKRRQDRYRFAVPRKQTRASFVPASGTLTAKPRDVIAVTGGSTAAITAGSQQVQPWSVTVTARAAVPAVGQRYFLPPGAKAFPTGLAGSVTAVAPTSGGGRRLTVTPAPLDDSLERLRVTDSGPLSDSMLIGRGSSARKPQAAELTGTVDFGKVDASIAACHGPDGRKVDVSGSLSLTLSNVHKHFQVNAGSFFTDPFVSVWVSYESTVTFDIAAERKAKCSLPAWWQNTHKKMFLISQTGATIAIAPDASFSISASGHVKVSHHSYRMVGFISNPDGTIRKLDAKSSDPVSVDFSGKIEVEAYVGIQVQIGELDIIGVGFSAGGGVRAAGELNTSRLCFTVTPFLRVTLYAYLNVWVAEWKLQAFEGELTFDGPEKCYPWRNPPDPALFGKIARVAATGVAVYVDSGGTRHWIPDAATYYCRTAWRGVPVINVAQEKVDALAEGAPDTCVVREAFNRIVRVGATGTAYYVDGSGVRHWIKDGGVFLCLKEWKGVSVYDNVSQEAANAFPEGSAARCSIPEAHNTIVRVGATGASYLVDGNGVRHWIKDGGVFLCLTEWKGVPVYGNLSQAAVDAFPEGGWASCTIPEAYNTIVRVGATGTAYFVDGGGVKHWIKDGGVFLCLTEWKGVSVYENLSQGAVDAFAEGGWASCTIPEAFNTIVRVGATGASYFVDGSGVKHWIKDGGVYNCLYYWKGVPAYENLSQGAVDAFPEGGWASCTIPEAYNTIVRVGATGVSYFVDGSGVRHWIKDGGVYNCLYYWKGVPAYEDLPQGAVDAFPEGGWASCTIPEAFNTIVRVGATGVSYFVDGSGVKHWIKDGGVYNCLYYWKGVPAYENLVQGAVDAFPEGGWASCTIPEAYNSVIRVAATGRAYFVDGGGVKHWIQDGATYNCLIKTHRLYHDLLQGAVDAFPEGGWQPKTSC